MRPPGVRESGFLTWLSLQLCDFGEVSPSFSATLSSEGFPVKVGVVAPRVLGLHSSLISSTWPPESTNFQL